MSKATGTIGKFNFLSPFDIFNTNKRLEIVSVKDIMELEDDSLNPYELIYKPVGLTVDDKALAVKGKVKVLVFRASGGYLYIPEDYVDKFTDVTGIPYQCKAIVLNVGTLPIDIDISNMLEDIQTIIGKHIGVKAGIETLETSAVTYLSREEDIRYTASRDILRTDGSNCEIRYAKLKKEYDELKKQEVALSCYIKSKL